MFDITINGRKIEFRGWKFKDKQELDKASNVIEKRKAIVYNCISDKKIALDIEEFNYLLYIIRNKSLSSKLSFCGNELVCNFKDADYKPITVNDIIIEVGHVSNRDDYEKRINETITDIERFVLDFVFHIKTINSSNVSVDEALNFFEEMDVELFEKIINQWDLMKSKFTYIVECPVCSETHNVFQNDEFFPKSWKI